MPTVTLHLKPLARRALIRLCPFDGHAFDISHSWIEPLLRASLRHRPSPPPQQAPANLVPVRLYISDWDAQHLGFFVPQPLQLNISSTLCTLERDNLCRLVCAAYLFTTASRAQAMRFYLDKFAYENDEINYPQLKKHYQRHFVHFEQQYLTDLQELHTAKSTQN